MPMNIDYLKRKNTFEEKTKNINKQRIFFNNIKRYKNFSSNTLNDKSCSSIIISPKNIIVMKIIKNGLLNRTTENIDY